MKEKATAVLMWISAVPITAAGFHAIMQEATTIFGALTAFFGFLMGVYGCIWWRRRLRRQKQKMEFEEMQLRVWREAHEKRARRAHRPNWGEEETE